MTNDQAQASAPANPEGAQAQTPANGSASPELQQFIASQTPTAPATPQDAQAQGQSSPAIEAQPDPIKDLQRIANERQVEIYRLQQQYQQLQQQMLELAQRALPQTSPQQNPYDPSTDWPNWIRWENQSTAKAVAEEARKASREELFGMMQQAQEFQWAQAHPGVDVNSVKAFARANGIAEWNLEASYRLMSYPQQMNQVAQTQAQQALQQFRQPQVGAQPLRGAQSAGSPQAGISYVQLAKQYEESNGLAYNSWPKEVQQAFDRETNFRYVSGA